MVFKKRKPVHAKVLRKKGFACKITTKFLKSHLRDSDLLHGAITTKLMNFEKFFLLWKEKLTCVYFKIILKHFFARRKWLTVSFYDVRVVLYKKWVHLFDFLRGQRFDDVKLIVGIIKLGSTPSWCHSGYQVWSL